MTILLELLKGKLTGAEEALSAFIKRINSATDDGEFRQSLQEVLADREKIEGVLQDFFIVVRLILSGSDPVEPGEFPQCVAIGNKQEGFFASGLLLSSRWLLTSSHCRDATKMSAGIQIDPSGKNYQITFKEENDLLVLFEVSDFKEPVAATLLPPDDYPLKVGTPLRVVAFGETGPYGGIFGQERQARFLVDKPLDVRIFASSDSGVCPGDSGGPAFYDDGNNNKPRLLLGICDSTIGDDCESGGIFANVVGKKGWIETVTGLTQPADRPGAVDSQSEIGPAAGAKRRLRSRRRAAP